jgi:hypothetical protein
MAHFFKFLRWASLCIMRAIYRTLLWVVRLTGSPRLFGLGVGGGLGAFFGSVTGVAFAGTAVVGSMFFAPLLAIIGFLGVSVAIYALRQRKLNKELGR